MESAVGLYGIQTLGGLLRLLPERDPHPRLYAALAAHPRLVRRAGRSPAR